jgi:hypothetical protein
MEVMEYWDRTMMYISLLVLDQSLWLPLDLWIPYSLAVEEVEVVPFLL